MARRARGSRAGETRAGARDASATRGPRASKRAPRPAVGGQSRAPLADEPGRSTLGLEKMLRALLGACSPHTPACGSPTHTW